MKNSLLKFSGQLQVQKIIYTFPLFSESLISTRNIKKKKKRHQILVGKSDSTMRRMVNYTLLSRLSVEHSVSQENQNTVHTLKLLVLSLQSFLPLLSPPQEQGTAFPADRRLLNSLNEAHSNHSFSVTIHTKTPNTTTYFLLFLWHHDLRATKVRRNLLIDLKICPLTLVLQRQIIASVIPQIFAESGLLKYSGWFFVAILDFTAFQLLKMLLSFSIKLH